MENYFSLTNKREWKYQKATTVDAKNYSWSFRVPFIFYSGLVSLLFYNIFTGIANYFSFFLKTYHPPVSISELPLVPHQWTFAPMFMIIGGFYILLIVLLTIKNYNKKKNNAASKMWSSNKFYDCFEFAALYFSGSLMSAR